MLVVPGPELTAAEPLAGGRARARGPVPRHVHLRHGGRAEGGAARPALPDRPARCRPSTGSRRRPERLVVVHGRLRLVEVGAQRLHRAVAARRGGAAARRALRPPRAAGDPRAEEVDTLCMAPTEYRVIAKRATLRRVRRAARARRRRRGAQPRGAARLARGDRAVDPRRLRPDGDRPAHRDAARRGGAARARWAARCRASSLDVLDGELVADPATVPTFFVRYLGGEAAPAGPWRTGDRVRRDDDGYLYFEGRLDDVIISAGYRIGPFEVESALVAHAAVAEAAVVAAPDEERGSVVRAVVVLRDGVAAVRARWRPSCRSTSRPRPRRTSTRASSTSPTSCPRRRAARSAARHSGLDKSRLRLVQSLAMTVTAPLTPTSPPSPSARRRGCVERTRRSGEYFERAHAVMPGGVPSSFQRNDPWPTYIERGTGAQVWDVDGNEYLDFHNGFGVMCVGHANPAISRRGQGADGPGHALRGADRGLDHRRGGAAPPLGHPPLALHQLRHRVDDGRRPPRARLHRPRRDREDRGHLPRPPRRRDGLRQAAAGPDGRPRAPQRDPLRPRLRAGHRGGDARRPVQRRRGGRARVRRARGPDRGHDPRAGDDEHQHRPRRSTATSSACASCARSTACR